jgi:hypothetical protein
MGNLPLNFYEGESMDSAFDACFFMNAADNLTLILVKAGWFFLPLSA